METVLQVATKADTAAVDVKVVLCVEGLSTLFLDLTMGRSMPRQTPLLLRP